MSVTIEEVRRVFISEAFSAPALLADLAIRAFEELPRWLSSKNSRD
jgi:hypothetical protein